MKISSLIIVSAMAAAATAESAHAETLAMTCEGYNVVFSPGSLTSHAPRKNLLADDFPKHNQQNTNGEAADDGDLADDLQNPHVHKVPQTIKRMQLTEALV